MSPRPRQRSCLAPAREFRSRTTSIGDNSYDRSNHHQSDHINIHDLEVVDRDAARVIEQKVADQREGRPALGASRPSTKQPRCAAPCADQGWALAAREGGRWEGPLRRQPGRSEALASDWLVEVHLYALTG